MKYRRSISLLCHCWIKSRKWLNYLSATCTGGWSGQLGDWRGGGGCRIESRGIKVKLYGGVDTGGNMRGRVRVGLGEGLNTSVGVSRSNTTTHTSLLPRFGNVTQTSRPWFSTVQTPTHAYIQTARQQQGLEGKWVDHYDDVQHLMLVVSMTPWYWMIQAGQWNR